MKKARVDELLIEKTLRRKKIIYYSIILVILLSSLALFIGIYIKENKTYYVSYSENTNLDYKVYLKDNEFFDDEYLGMNKQYITNLIDYIKGDFTYKLNMSEDNINYNYSYKIVATASITNRNSKNVLYSYKEDLVKEKEYSSSDSSVSIDDSVKIDYNYFNNIVSKFISTYKVDDVSANLEVKMYVDVTSNCADLERENKNSSTISMNIPLTYNTMSISIDEDKVDDDSIENLLACKKQDNHNVITVIMMIITIGIVITILVDLIKYIMDTRSAKSIYDAEISKIMNNYRSYIQKINNNFDLKGYQVLWVDTFTDMLEIRDTIQEPILMVENKDKDGTFFLIPSKTKILYSYRLKVSDIEKKQEL